jgi:hypothetical protein
VESDGLVPVTVGTEETAHRDGNGEGMRKTCMASGIVRGCVQVLALCFQPDGCLPEGGESGGLRWGARPPAWARERSAVDAERRVKVAADGQNGVQVVVKQAPDRLA